VVAPVGLSRVVGGSTRASRRCRSHPVRYWLAAGGERRAGGGPALFGVLIWLLFVRFVVPVLGVFYGTALMADEVDDKTITYLFTRPVPRASILLANTLRT